MIYDDDRDGVTAAAHAKRITNKTSENVSDGIVHCYS